MAKNPYTLLGVEKSATDAEIRKAYRALAKKLHPDVNPDNKAAEDRFKEVTAAYTLLTDKELRKQYDTGQVDASGQQQNPFGGGRPGGGPGYSTGFGGFSGMRGGGGQDDMADLFSSLFGMNMGNQRGGRPRPQVRPQKGADVRYKLDLTLPDALKGGSRLLGSGVKVKIPAGVKDGQTLRVRGKGQPGVNGGPAGDAKIKVTVSDHKNLRRDNDDLHLDLPISLNEAMSGAKVTVDMPTGSVSLKLPAGTNTGKRLRLKGKGVGSGDLYVRVQIRLTDEELQRTVALADVVSDVESGEKLRNSLF